MSSTYPLFILAKYYIQNMKHVIAILFLVFAIAAVPEKLFAQQTKIVYHYTTPIWVKRQNNSTESQADRESFQFHMEKAKVAYHWGELEKTKYHLNHAERNGWRSGEFYMILGHWAKDTGNERAAKRYWKRGYDKWGCWECKELIEELKR